MFAQSWIRNIFSFHPPKPLKKSKPARKLSLLGLEERITPTTYFVSNIGDGGDGSLRQAIINANASDNAPDIINFSVGDTITLQSSLPDIANAARVGTLTINGLNPSILTISGNNGDDGRDFNIFNINSGGDLTISGVTISGAYSFSLSGGAFNNLGNLSISNSNISGNFAKNGGGAIFNDGTLTVTNSTLSDNSADSLGGAIINQSSKTLTVSNSTLSGNFAKFDGGGIYNRGTLTVTNSTLSGNSSDFKGGGIYNRGTLNIANTIIANSTKGDFAGTAPATNSNNLVEDGSLPGTGELIGDPLLGPLQNNDGPTFTMALEAGSAAIDAGNATFSNASPVNFVDQRGYIRSATTPSIGAFEFNGISPAPTVTSITPASGPSTGGTTITITGTNLTGASSVIIGGIIGGAFATNVTVDNATKITATTPAGTVGTASVQVTNAYGTNAANTLFTFIGAANTPTFGTPTSTANGFTVQITNYVGAFTYAGSATAGTVAISGTGLVTVTGVAANTSSSVTITTSRTNYTSGSATVAATSLNAANTPTFGTAMPTANGFTVQITNYEGAFSYAGTAMESGTVGINETGLVTVTGVAANTSSSAIITTTRTNYVTGSATVTATSLNAANTPTFGTPAPTVSGFTVQISNYDGAFSYAGSATPSGTVAINGTGLVTVTGVATNTSSTVTITTSRTNNVSGSATVTATSLAPPTISSISPASGLFTGGTAITITGAALTGATAVTIGGVAATFTVDNATTITATTPAGALGTASVLVTTPGGTNAATTLFTYTNAITVTTTADTVIPGDGVISLREAIINANETPGNDQINFKLTGSTAYTITLGSALPDILSAEAAGTLAINGLGAFVLTISGSNATNPNNATRNFRIFKIVSGADLTLSDMTLSGAQCHISGGAIENGGTLTIANSILAGNATFGGIGLGGAIFNSGTLTISNSTLFGNAATGAVKVFGNDFNIGGEGSGGAIYNTGTLTISNSTFSFNTATGGSTSIGGNSSGGAIDNSGTLAISNSTFFGNAANGGQGIKGGNGSGGAINNVGAINNAERSGILTITNSTLSDNAATGAIIGGSSSGGGINNGGTLNITNTIIANSSNGDDFSGSAPTTNTRNLVEDGSLPGIEEINLDPLLGPLQYNGGLTFTMALLTGSPALVIGDATLSNASPIFALDQRGYARNYGFPNIGAWEDIGIPAAPTVASVSPASGPITGGTTLTITGANLAGVLGVTIGGNVATHVTVVSNTSLTVTTPAGAAVPTSVEVYTIGGFSGDNTLFTYVEAANTPTFGTPTPTANGFSVQINNYDNSFNYAGSAIVGTVAISNSGLVTVTGVAANTSSTATITTTRDNYANGSSQVTATSLNAANTPTFATPTSTANGFTVQISNFDGAFSYAGSATANGTIAINGTGLITVTGVAANTSSTVTITTSRTNYVNGSATVAATSLNAANTPTFGTPTPTVNGFTVQISNYDGAFSYAGIANANGTVAINGTGLVTVIGVAPNTPSTVTITTSRTNYVNGSATVTATSLTRIAPLVTGTTPLSSGGSSTVTLFNQDTGKAIGNAEPFPNFRGEIRVSTGDFNKDGKSEIVVAAGPGGGPAVTILDSETGVVRAAFFAYSQDFTGGVFVAVKDINNDGVVDIITGAGAGGGPHVKVFDGKNLQVMASFFAYSQAFSGGVSVASADINGDNILDIVTGAGPGGGPHVKVFDGASRGLISEWFAYPGNFKGGVFVAVGDIGNDGKFEVITGAGPGGGPMVAVFNPFTGALQRQFFAYAVSFSGGVRVGVNDANADGVLDLVTGAGPGGAPHVKGFNYPQLDLLFEFFSGPVNNTGGVFLS